MLRGPTEARRVALEDDVVVANDEEGFRAPLLKVSPKRLKGSRSHSLALRRIYRPILRPTGREASDGHRGADQQQNENAPPHRKYQLFSNPNRVAIALKGLSAQHHDARNGCRGAEASGWARREPNSACK